MTRVSMLATATHRLGPFSHTHVSLHRVLVFGSCPPWVAVLSTWNPSGHRDPLSHPPVHPAFSHCEASGCLPAQCLVNLCF